MNTSTGLTVHSDTGQSKNWGLLYMANKEMEEGKIFAFLAYLLGIIGFLIVLLAKKDNKFAMYHAKQSLVLFIAWVAIWLIAWIPVLGWIIGFIGWIFLVVLWILGMINALTEKQKPLPIIGKFADKIKL